MSDLFDFTVALNHMKCGLLVRRQAWVKHIFIYHFSDHSVILLVDMAKNVEKVWSPSQPQILATDWELIYTPIKAYRKIFEEN